MKIIITESQKKSIIYSIRRRPKEIIDSMDDFVRYGPQGHRAQYLSEDDFLEETAKKYLQAFIGHFDLKDSVEPQDIPVLEKVIETIIEKWVRKYYKWYQKRHVNFDR